MIDALEVQLAPIDKQLYLRAPPARLPGAMGHYGIGALTAVTILAELGDAWRLVLAGSAVRYAGLDVTVHQSDHRLAPATCRARGTPAAAPGAVRGRPGRAPHQA